MLQTTPEQLKQDYKFSCKSGNFEGTIYDYLKTKLELKEYSDLLGTTPENLLVAHYKKIANKKGFKSDIFDYVLHEVIKKCSKITGKSVQELTVEYAKHYDIGKKNSDTIKTFKKNELKTHVMSVTIEAMNTSLTEITEAYILFQTEGYAGTIETYILQTFDAYQQGTTIEELFKHQYEYLVQNGYNKSYAEYLSHISTPKKGPIKSEEKSYYKSAN